MSGFIVSKTIDVDKVLFILYNLVFKVVFVFIILSTWFLNFNSIFCYDLL